MSDTVYLIGAGVNQGIRDESYSEPLSPPLVKNFFQVALKIDRYANAHYTKEIQELLDFINKYWKKDKAALLSTPFDLEECFTFIEAKLEEASRVGDSESRKTLDRIGFRLRVFVSQVLSEIWTSIISDTMMQFGVLLFHQKPTIITFNYDTFIEEAVAAASGINLDEPDIDWSRDSDDVPEIELPYSHNNWNSRLAYSITFDEVQLARAGISTYVDGKKFYSHPKNKLYDWSILKLHGSLNWFKHLPIHLLSGYSEFKEKPKEGTIVCEQHFWSWNNQLPMIGGWYIDPIIVPPTLYKEQYFDDEIYKKVIIPLWDKARTALSRCKKLVVIGYSFPTTDFATKKLFLEAFLENQLEELTIVNPDSSVSQKIREYCHFNKPIREYKDLEDFMKSAN